ncbi:MAG: hypothetical protein ACT4PU_09410 [Planctomycetota bacterium]
MGSREAAVLLLTLTLGSPLGAQMQITHTYPFTAARAVVTKVDGSDVTIYAGSGSGVFVLEGDTEEPVLKSGVANELRAGGLVRDLYVTDDHVYVAVHRAGLSRFRRGAAPSAPDPEWVTEEDMDGDISDTWAVNVPWQYEDVDLIFAGTNDDYYDFDSASGGKLHLIHASTSTEPDAPVRKDTIDLGAPIYTLASKTYVHNGDNYVMLLVGTACRQSGSSYAALLRYDFNVEEGLPESFPSPTAVWNPTVSGSTVPTFIRDIVIDPVDDVAYVAAYTRGVFKVNVPDGPTGGLSTASGSWPITAGADLKSYFLSLALYEGSLGSVLVVGKGLGGTVGGNYWGDCSYFAPCDDFPCLEEEDCFERFGMSLYDVSFTHPVEVATLNRQSMKTMGLSVRQTGSTLRIDAAALQSGLFTFEATPQSGGFDLEELGRWNIDDGQSTGQYDDILRLGNNLFVGMEQGIAAFDITETGGVPSSDLFTSLVDAEAGGGVVLAGCLAADGFPTMVFASALESGVALYEVSGEGSTANVINRDLFLPTAEGGLVRTYSVAALSPTETPDGYPWMIAVNAFDSTTEPPGCSVVAANGSVRIYRVVLNGSGELDRDSLVSLGSYAPSSCTTATGTLVGAYAMGGEETVTVLVGYSPRVNGGSGPSETGAGLLFLRFTYNPVTDRVSVTSSNKVEAVEDAAEANTGFVHYKTSHGLVTAGLGCNGVASFSLSEVLVSKFPASGSSPTSFLDCATGPDDRIYCTALDGRIWVFDPTDMEVPVATFETRDQAATIVSATSTVSGNPQPGAFYIADFIAGLHRVQFQTTP